MDHKMETVEVRLHYHESSLRDVQAVLKGSWEWLPSLFCDKRRICSCPEKSMVF